MAYLANSPSKRWLSDQTQAALEGTSETHGYELPLVDDESAGADLLARGIPIGLMHSMGTMDEVALRADAAAVTRITHGSPVAFTLVEAVARAVAIAARQETPLGDLRLAVAVGLPDGEVRNVLSQEAFADPRSAVSVLASALDVAGSAGSFQEALEESVVPGGATDARATLVGALYAGHHGSAAIPQRLIDGLESRIYVSLAVPWFYRTVARLRGRAIELRADFGWP